MEIIYKRSLTTLLILLCVLLCGYAVFEWSTYSNKPTPENKNSLAEDAVNNAVENFRDYLFDFTNQSAELTGEIESRIKAGEMPEEIYNALSPSSPFWGVVLYKDGATVFWDGFVPDAYPEDSPQNSDLSRISIGTNNNVTYFYNILPFFADGDTALARYDVYTRAKISQDNILELGKELEMDPALLFGSDKSYPVFFSFGESTDQTDVLHSEVVSLSSSDSIATIYALDSSYESFRAKYDYQNALKRGLFYIAFLVLGGLFILILARSIGGITGVLLQLVAFTTVWFLLRTIYPIIEGSQNFSSLPDITLIRYAVNAIFATLISISIIPFLINHKSEMKISDPGKLFIAGLAVSALSAISFHGFFMQTFQLMVHSDVQIMDLELIPSLPTLILYVTGSLYFVSIALVNGTFIWFILTKTPRTFWFTIAGLITGFLFTDMLYRFIMPDGAEYSWILLINGLLFSVILIFSVYVFQRNPQFLYSSKLRLLLFLGYLTVCFSYIPMSNGNVHRLNERMLNEAESFSKDEENEIENITKSILSQLEQNVNGNPNRLFNDVPFARLMESIIEPEWLRYTISIQLIDKSGDRFADYTTSLSPPQWSTAYRITELEIPFEEERIQRENLRPIIRNRPINTINSSYSSFRRGWIPIFENDSSDVRSGWILCSVYRELPQLDRPLRTVINASESSEWEQTLVTTEYHDGVAIRSSITGIPLEIPTPSLLSEKLRMHIKADSVYRTTSTYGYQKVKELYLLQNGTNIVRVGANNIGVAQHIFALLRFFFLLVIIGVLFMISVSWKKNWHIFGYSRRFRDRLIDRFILASLVCLVALVGASYTVLSAQNQDDVRERLFDRLGNLVDNLQATGDLNVTNASNLQQITSILDVDAALYEDGQLVNSTTSQIFAQHLIPSTLPWDVYHRITTKESSEEIRIINLDKQDMMIGYEPWLNSENEIAGIVAIPTFLKAPKFYERILSTTSYLLAAFTLIFGALMLAVGFISSSLTAPLEELREGLKRISDGDLETTLPVRGNDEIGTLTKAYNQMGKRLKKVQNELAETEREEAWKEMARQVAHEIKNPLTPMKLNLQHLDRQMTNSDTDPEKLKSRVSKITSSMIEQIEALSKIASDFSKFAKPIEQDFYPIEINELVESVSEFYLQDDSISLNVDLHKEPLHVSGVKEELRRVLVNLVKNAQEATGDGGRISLHTFTDPQRKHVFIEVTDNGDGIPLEDQERIFVPNFSTKTSGTGLGLAISKKIIEEHDGEITFISTLGQGTSFTIRLPMNG